MFLQIFYNYFKNILDFSKKNWKNILEFFCLLTILLVHATVREGYLGEKNSTKSFCIFFENNFDKCLLFLKFFYKKLKIFVKKSKVFGKMSKKYFSCKVSFSNTVHVTCHMTLLEIVIC